MRIRMRIDKISLASPHYANWLELGRTKVTRMVGVFHAESRVILRPVMIIQYMSALQVLAFVLGEVSVL